MGRLGRLCRWFALLALTTSVQPACLEAQSATSDTVPHFDFAIDPASIAARLRPLRATQLRRGEREIRVWTGFGLGIPHLLYRLRVSGRATDGAVIAWWDHSGEWGPSDNPESMHAHVRREFRCGRIRRHEDTEASEIRLGRRPTWRQLVAQLDSLGISTLQTPANRLLVMDGFHMVIETREHDRYHTAYFPMPSPTGPGDTPRAHAILELLHRIEVTSRPAAEPKR